MTQEQREWLDKKVSEVEQRLEVSTSRGGIVRVLIQYFMDLEEAEDLEDDRCRRSG